MQKNLPTNLVIDTFLWNIWLELQTTNSQPISGFRISVLTTNQNFLASCSKSAMYEIERYLEVAQKRDVLKEKFSINHADNPTNCNLVPAIKVFQLFQDIFIASKTTPLSPVHSTTTTWQKKRKLKFDDVVSHKNSHVRFCRSIAAMEHRSGEEERIIRRSWIRDFSISRRSTDFLPPRSHLSSLYFPFPFSCFFPWLASRGVPQYTERVTRRTAIKQTIERQYSLLSKQWLTYGDHKQSPYPQVVNAA